MVPDTFFLRLMMFLLGAVFFGGGAVFCKQAFEDSKNLFESVAFSLMGVATGLVLIVWAFVGPPG